MENVKQDPELLQRGHSNALRQAKKLGDVLVVGVHSDGELSSCILK